MISQVQKFKDLHHQNEPLLLGNVWDAQSAKVLETSGYKALGTSSYAVAEMLGYEDGENIPFEEYLMIINRITKSTSLPLSVDIESGFGATDKVVIDNIVKLYNLGVVGINIEDSIVKNGVRMLTDSKVFSQKIKNIVTTLALKNIEIFINVRCDAFLLDVPNKMEEAKKRIKLYEENDISGVFLPCIIDENDIKEIVATIKYPLNVLGLPNFSNFDTLQKLGVKRISIGNFVNGHIYKEMAKICSKIKEDGNFSALFQ